MKKILLSSLIISTLLLSGCAAALFGGAITAAATAHDRRTPGTVIDDKKLEVVISQKLLSNKFIDDNSHTNLTIYNGVVLVTGEAANQIVINSIITTIQQVPNIKSIQEDISIMPSSSILSRANDAAITSKVKAVLFPLNLPNFDPTLINVSTERGKVYLMGLVTPDEARVIIDKARRVKGVVSVVEVFEYMDNKQKPASQSVQ